MSWVIYILHQLSESWMFQTFLKGNVQRGGITTGIKNSKYLCIFCAFWHPWVLKCLVGRERKINIASVVYIISHLPSLSGQNSFQVESLIYFIFFFFFTLKTLFKATSMSVTSEHCLLCWKRAH